MAQGFSGERQFTWRALAICILISVSVLGFGYPTAIIGTTLSQPSFLTYMHLVDADGQPASNAESWIGTISGVYQAGGVIAIVIGIWVMDRFGRKVGMTYASICGAVGAIGCCASQNLTLFVVFRFFAGAGAWSVLCVAPVYIAELAPPSLRGLFVTLTGVQLMIGQALASYMGLAFFSVQAAGSSQWRGPMGVQILFPTITLAIVYWLPESPRWLLMKSQTEKAREVVMNLHGKDTAAQEFASAEFYQMSKQAEFDRTLDSSWRACFSKPSYRKRFEICCMYGWVTQSTGLLVISAYGSVLYGTLGYGPREQILFQCGYITVAVAFNILGDLIVDIVGRKLLMIVGLSSCVVWMSVETAMVALYASPVPEHPNKSGLAMAVAALYLFIAFYAPTIDTAGFVYYAEVFPNHLRAKGVSAAICCAALIDVVYLQVASTAFKTIGWRFFLVFIIIPFLGAIYIWIRYPETKGIPLEEIARHFGDEDQVMVFSEDIVINHDNHKLIITKHGVGGETMDSEKNIQTVTADTVVHLESA